VQLGEKITATIQAKYYFGAPVTKAKVKYKVLRSSHDSSWYPVGRLDWFYGKVTGGLPVTTAGIRAGLTGAGKRPMPIWVVGLEPRAARGRAGERSRDWSRWRGQGADRHAAAKELHGNQDHKYSLTAEVVDESRRTIVGTGDVLVSRKPFHGVLVCGSWSLRIGDTVHASFSAHTLGPETG